MNVDVILEELEASGNLRTIPIDRVHDNVLDFSVNDYMGIAGMTSLAREFEKDVKITPGLMTLSASRLLAASQDIHCRLEETLESQYGRPALAFNSGWHVNTGLIPALCDKKTLIVADKLVHASIIDGMMLAGCEWTRFRHNDISHLEQIIERRRPGGENVLVIVESVYSMDGDSAPVEEILEVKKRHPGVVLYIDEAHAYGVVGNHGVGLAYSSSAPAEWDVVVGTLGKAAASAGAFAIMDSRLKRLAINRARSFIFSTGLPPVNILWSTFVVNKLWGMDREREHLSSLASYLAEKLGEVTGTYRSPSHIQPLIVGDAKRAVELSRALESDGIKVLPIRTPTVPPGTERLRLSLSAGMSREDIDRLVTSINKNIVTSIGNNIIRL